MYHFDFLHEDTHLKTEKQHSLFEWVFPDINTYAKQYLLEIHKRTPRR